MELQPIRFDDGAAYETGMGVWSQIAGRVFLDWLAAPAGLRWVDVGCGNGAFTELLIERCAPSEVQAIDPSDGQLSFARTRPGAQRAVFQKGDAMALPFADDAFDAAVMALVLFFVPDPAVGLGEMMRVTAPGGLVSAYLWDVHGGGMPIAPIQAGLKSLGLTPVHPPSADISRMDALEALWRHAGLADVQTRVITVERRFPDFEAYWSAGLKVGSLGERMASLSGDQIAAIKERARLAVAAGTDGVVVATGRAHAVQGRMPA